MASDAEYKILETAVRELQSERTELLTELGKLRSDSVNVESLRSAYNELLSKFIEVKGRREPK